MKLNRIISTALVFVMLFAALASLVPVTALAEESEGVKVSVATSDEIITDEATIKEICNEYLNYGSLYTDANNTVKDFTFETAEELLAYELDPNGDGDGSDGYLDSIESGNYILYVNRYTGFVYYQNKVTGQIITSNPIDPSSIMEANRTEVMSQLEVGYYIISNPGSKPKEENSLKWIMQGSTLSLSEIENGISVKYCIGEVASSSVFLVPGAVVKEDFEEYITGPAFAAIAEMLEAACGEIDTVAIDNIAKSYPRIKSGVITSYNLSECSIGAEYYITDVTNALKVLQSYSKSRADSATHTRINSLITNVTQLLQYYTLDDPDYDKSYDEDMYNLKAEQSLAYADGQSVYFIKITDTSNPLATYRLVGQFITACAPEYTTELSDEHEDNAGYMSDSFDTPSFTCSINYTLDENGVLSVEIPANSQDLSYNNTIYSIDSITPLKYFGAGDMNYDGYFFYPDGSGTVVEFGDFYFGAGNLRNINLSVSSALYGYDYCYSYLSAAAHHEQVTMPVYGIVSESKTNAASAVYTGDRTTTGGFFAVVEDGTSLTNLSFESNASSHKYGFTYATFSPSFCDTYDLSQSLSVGGLGSYKMFSATSYQGDFKVRYTMLDDSEVALAAKTAGDISSYYEADYIGMASCYRDYLSAAGALEALEETSLDLPLYIEVLGSMDITKKVLTFPVTVSTSLTTFEDIAAMYKDLSDLSGYVVKLGEKAEEYRAMADEIELGDATDDDLLRAEQYRSMADHYDELAAKVEDIKNVNFKLSGFANGGMYFTYPAKVKWESSVGGKRGFKELIAYADDVNGSGDSHLGIYPDFDFVYINNTAAFDGVSNSRISSRMIDNRYASKQVYDSVSQEYETIYSILASSDSFDKMYSKFLKKYSKYDITNISVSTLGSDLNSNLNAKNTVDREASLNNVKSLLDRMSNTDGYSLMTDVGNSYALEYVDHVINVSTDSSHFIDSSYAIPFFGLVFHGSLNYAGAPLNYSGSPEYDILRSIENGASIYYILCNDNTGFLKEDPLLSDYYGIDYENWFDKIVEQYTEINEAIGDLNYHRIVDHEILYAERVIGDDEMLANFARLGNEYIDAVYNCLSDAIDAKQKELRGSATPGLEVIIDRDTLMYALAEKLGFDFEGDSSAQDKLLRLKSVTEIVATLSLSLDSIESLYPAVEDAVVVEIEADSIALSDVTLDNVADKISDAILAKVSEVAASRPGRDIEVEINREDVIAVLYSAIGLSSAEANAAISLDATVDAFESVYKYDSEYTGNKNTMSFDADDVVYESLYSYTTDSISTDKANYKYTDFTCDNGSVVMVTYEKDGETVVFILNYNFYTVEVTLDNTIDKSIADGDTKTYTLGQYEYVRIDNN